VKIDGVLLCVRGALRGAFASSFVLPVTLPPPFSLVYASFSCTRMPPLCSRNLIGTIEAPWRAFCRFIVQTLAAVESRDCCGDVSRGSPAGILPPSPEGDLIDRLESKIFLEACWHLTPFNTSISGYRTAGNTRGRAGLRKVRAKLANKPTTWKANLDFTEIYTMYDHGGRLRKIVRTRAWQSEVFSCGYAKSSSI
jgi:hypothetical protein